MATPFMLHASAFAYDGAGCLVIGDAGSGKSTLLAQALLHGAHMIADDRVALHAEDGVLVATAPSTLAGVVELNGLGLISQPHITHHPMHLVVALQGGATERLPEPEQVHYCGLALPLRALSRPAPAEVAALLLYLKAVQEKRTLPTDWLPGR